MYCHLKDPWIDAKPAEIKEWGSTATDNTPCNRGVEAAEMQPAERGTMKNDDAGDSVRLAAPAAQGVAATQLFKRQIFRAAAHCPHAPPPPTLYMQPCTGSPAQEWTFRADGALVSSSNPSLCLTSSDPGSPAGLPSLLPCQNRDHAPFTLPSEQTWRYQRQRGGVVMSGTNK